MLNVICQMLEVNVIMLNLLFERTRENYYG